VAYKYKSYTTDDEKVVKQKAFERITATVKGGLTSR